MVRNDAPNNFCLGMEVRVDKTLIFLKGIFFGARIIQKEVSMLESLTAKEIVLLAKKIEHCQRQATTEEAVFRLQDLKREIEESLRERRSFLLASFAVDDIIF